MKTKYLLPLLLFLSACDAIYGVVATVTAVEVGSTVVTGKTVGDRVASDVKGQDCQIARWLDGRKYCLEPQPAAEPVRPSSYCYQSIAGVDCFSEPIENQNDRLLNR